MVNEKSINDNFDPITRCCPNLIVHSKTFFIPSILFENDDNLIAKPLLCNLGLFFKYGCSSKTHCLSLYVEKMNLKKKDFKIRESLEVSLVGFKLFSYPSSFGSKVPRCRGRSHWFAMLCYMARS